MATAFRLSVLNTAMRAPGADWVVGFVGVTVSLAVFLAMKWQLNVGLVAVAIFTGLGGFLGVRSRRRLWRAGRTRPEILLYDHGVRGWGASMLIATPIIGSVGVSIAADAFHNLRVWPLIVYVAFAGFLVSLPGCLWGGYIFGSLLGGVDGKDASDLPPAA